MFNQSVVKALKTARKELERDLEKVNQALSFLGAHPKRGKRVLSQEARDRIAEAQRQRWAKARKAKVISIKKPVKRAA